MGESMKAGILFRWGFLVGGRTLVPAQPTLVHQPGAVRHRVGGATWR